VDAAGRFSNAPARTGWRYWFDRSLRGPLAREIGAQFQKFRATGLPLDHVNGHLHLHLHPAVLPMVVGHAREWGVAPVRLTRDAFWLNARLASGRWWYRASHAVVFGWLARRARRALRQAGLRHPQRVFGLLQDGRVDEAFVTRLLPRLPPGDSELYSHPSLAEFRPEFDALVSPRVRRLVDDLGIRLIRYRDL
jgi:predicted glycoside hydrolase/deacetylase ChbG (UPF0249 family)